MKKPANIDYFHTLETLPSLIAMMPGFVQVQLADVDSFMVNQRRGRAHLRRNWDEKGTKVIKLWFTIPVWILNKPLDYQLWYVAHECSHIMDYKTRGTSDHGPEFHEWLKKICPLASQHHEWNYMKRSQNRGVGLNYEEI